MSSSNTQQEIVMVTGKGGVGKSLVASAIAWNFASQGKKVLLVELGSRSQLQHIFGEPIDFEAKEVSPSLWVARWEGESCLREYLQHLFKLKAVVNLFFNNRIMKAFVRAAPALKELAILGKVTSGVRHFGPKLTYDVVVVDAFATGHFLALLRVPKGMGELIKVGPIGEQSRSIYKTLVNPQVTKLVLVALPEELPIAETVELAEQLKVEFHMEPTLVCNKWLDLEGWTDDELHSLENELEGEGQADNELGFVKYLRIILKRQNRAVDELRKLGRPIARVKYIFDAQGKELMLKASSQLEKLWNLS